MARMMLNSNPNKAWKRRLNNISQIFRRAYQPTFINFQEGTTCLAK